MKKLLLACIILLMGTATEAQPYINFINNTTCTVWQNFYFRDGNSCAAPLVSVGGAIGAGTTTYDATALYGSTPPAGCYWMYGRIGDDPASCTFQAAGSGCSANRFLTISDGVCTPGVTSGCYNADVSSTCNTCGNPQINISTVYYTNGDLDVIIN